MEFKELFMLCQSTNEDEALKLDNERYKANIKYDGERVISVIINHDVIMVNRRGNILNFKFKDVEEELKKLPNTILDGEIITEDDNFNKLQKRALTKNPKLILKLTKEIKVNYMLFDILKLEDENLFSKPLKERVLILNKIVDTSKFNILKLVAYDGIKPLLEKAKNELREGIIVKDMLSVYENKRSNNWKKLKLFKETTITITKYEENNKGIRAEDNLGNAVQIAGTQSIEVKNILDLQGSCEIYIQYLTQSEETKRYRFPSFRQIKRGNENDNQK